MSISYVEAVAIVEAVAVEIRTRSKLLRSEEIPLTEAVGRIAAREYVSPRSTPTFDSSAMDGFAIVSDATRQASQDNPIIFRVHACTLAGDPAACTTSLPGRNGLNPCIEIMTGAKFPVVQDGEQNFDAVIKVEDVTEFVLETELGRTRCIEVTRPVVKNSNKRFAGNDFEKGQLILRNHDTIRSHHIMAMASLGYTVVEVRTKVRVGLWSTGRELAPSMENSCRDSHIMDANGPYLEAALREFGVEVDFLGTIYDDELAFVKVLQEAAHSEHYDILVTTGAVSKGKADFVPSGLRSCGAKVRFHGVSMRPGHPVLFATLPLLSSSSRPFAKVNPHFQTKHVSIDEIAFFGLPGNPIATAACMRFLLIPYMHSLLEIGREIPIRATMINANRTSKSPEHNDSIKDKKHELKADFFKHGILSTDSSTTGWTVELSTDQSPAKLRPFVAANCWCHIRPNEFETDAGTIVDCFPF